MPESLALSMVFGLLSAASWGAGDFTGGLVTKRQSAYLVIIWSQLVGALTLGSLGLLFAESLPSTPNLLLAGATGILGSVGLMSLYMALASGHMSIAAPITAVLTAAIPVLINAFTDELPAPLQLLGFGLALLGIWLVSRPEQASVRQRELLLALLAGVCFGLFLVLIHRISGEAVFFPLLGARVGSVSFWLLVVTVRGQPLRPEIPLLPLTALAGVLDAGGNAFFVLAGQAGRLDIAAVVSSLYPASTILLAWLLLKEQISRLQVVGIGAALLAIVLITA